MTKQEQTNKIVAENAGKSRKEIIQIIRDQLGMTDAGASTYYYNATKKIAAVAKTIEAAREMGVAVAPESKAAETVAAKHWTDEWASINAEARKKVDAFVAAIDLNELPQFLMRK